MIDNKNGAVYRYEYDKMHRLTNEYSTGGNSLQTSSVINFNSYDSKHFHAVKNISFNDTYKSYTYDLNGNMTYGPDFSDPDQIAYRYITYNSDNMPTSITHSKAGKSTTVDYKDLIDFEELLQSR